MNPPTCPSCSAHLGAKEVADGWCEQCGKKIPAYVLHAVAAAGPLPAPAALRTAPERIAVAAMAEPLPPRQADSWWLVPLPEERRTQARKAAIIGLISSVPMFLFFGGVALVLPLLKGPLDTGGLVCLGPMAGLCLAAVVNFVAIRSGRRLSVLAWLLVPGLFFGLVFVVNSLSSGMAMKPIKDRIANARDGEPDFSPDADLKKGFLAVLDKVGQAKKPEWHVRLTEKHETAPPPEALNALEVWKLDRDFAEFERLKMKIPGSDPSCIDLHGGLVERRLRDALAPIIPKRLMDIAHLPASDPSQGKLVLELEATTRHAGTFSKLTSGFGKPVLAADLRIDWQVRLLDRDGALLYQGAWASRPSAGLSMSNVPLGVAYGPYKIMQQSAHDNFAREFLGRLGLAPGPEKKEWSFNEW